MFYVDGTPFYRMHLQLLPQKSPSSMAPDGAIRYPKYVFGVGERDAIFSKQKLAFCVDETIPYFSNVHLV